MIVRILGEGQLELADTEVEALNELDTRLASAVEADDEAAFSAALSDLLGRVRSVGRPLPTEELVPSDLVLPSADAGIAEVRELLTEEGLIAG